jgi:hypothetical protein
MRLSDDNDDADSNATPPKTSAVMDIVDEPKSRKGLPFKQYSALFKHRVVMFAFSTQSDASRRFGVDRGTISRCVWDRDKIVDNGARSSLQREKGEGQAPSCHHSPAPRPQA